MDTNIDSSAKTIGGITGMILLIYGVIKILDYYDIGVDKYGSYLAFYIFLFISSYVLPTSNKNIAN